MKNVYIFGVGKGKETVREYLIEDNVRLLGYIDNNAHRFPDGAVTSVTVTSTEVFPTGIISSCR